jgi:double-GTPase-like protein
MRIVMLGLQETGKTTYSVGVFASAKNRPTAGIKVVGVLDPVDTLNRGQELLGKRQSVVRSDTESVDQIGLELELGDGSKHSLRVPDRSGEALRGSLHGRAWQRGLRDDLIAAEGLMLFLRPKKVLPGEPVAAVSDLVNNEDSEDSEEIFWTPALMPTDAAMVDALQEIRDARGGDLVPICVVISAWDEVAGKTPRQWFTERVPLLAQYLASNAAEIPSALFAVSIQGGSFKGVGAKVSDDEPDPWDRARAYLEDGGEAEIASPLIWLLQAGSG